MIAPKLKNETAEIVEVDILPDGEIVSVTISVTRDDGSNEQFVVST